MLLSTIVGAALTPFGQVRGQGSQFALRFYGTGTNQQDRVRIRIDDDVNGPDASAACDVGAGGFTVEFWLRGNLSDNNTGNGGGDVETSDINWINGNIIVDRDIFGGSEADWGISIAGGFIRFGTGRGDPPTADSDNTIEGSVNVLDGQWHHAACVRDASTGIKRLYVDGLLDFQSSADASRDDISYPNAGAPGQVTPWGPYIVLAAEKHDAGPSYPSFTGFLDELRIWNTARSQGQILSSYDRVIPANSTGLVAYYRFEEGAGTTVNDSSTAGSPDGQLIAGVFGNGEWVSFAANASNTAPVTSGSLPVGIQRTTLVDNLNEPTVIAFPPDGRLLIAERGGRILIHQGGSLLPAPLIQIDANTLFGERGLVGLTIDPNFASNGFLYAYYTTQAPRNRVGRFTVVGNAANPASEALIWQNPVLAADFHHGGSIAFGPDGNLYISTGDQFDSGNSQDLTNEHGKILRVRPDGTIPPTNPFIGVPGARPAIWAYGLRNPFRIGFDPTTGRLWIGDVGGNSDDSWEEVNRGVAGANYGWPNQEGPACYVSDCSPYVFPAYTYQHNDPTYFTTQNQGSISLGPVYRGTAFPIGYRGNLFFGDYANRWIRRLVIDGAGNVLGDPLFLAPPQAGTIVDLKVGPDGALYYVTVGVPWSGAPDRGAVHRIAYSASGNQAPVVFVDANPRQGIEPLAVAFSSAGTFDPDNGPSALTFGWQFGDGGTSNLPNPSHTYTIRGLFTARLAVSDGGDEVNSTPIDITVGNPPTPTITLPVGGTTYRASDIISYAGTAGDAEDGTLPASGFRWRVILRHADHVHPFFGPVIGIREGNFAIPVTGHAPGDTNYEIELTVTDSDGLQTTATRAINPVLATIVLDTDPGGIPVFLDGEAVNTPRSMDSLVNFQHTVEAQATFSLGGNPYTFQCWSDGGARVHSYVVPGAGGSLTANYAPPQGQQTVVATVASNDGDADYHPPFGEELGNFYDAFGLCVGQESDGPWQAAAAFSLAVSREAQILSAVLRVTATGDQSGSPSAVIRAYEVGSASPFSATHTHALSQHHATTSSSVAWTFPTFVPGQAYDSPDLSALVQAVVNRPDWSANQVLGLVLDGSPSPAGTWRCFRDFTSGTPTQLTVVYAAGSAGSPNCCDPPCDDGDFCNGLELCVDGACASGAPPCSAEECDESADRCSTGPVPTLGAWGLAALALLILAIGTVRVRHANA